jgi:hypothetical protein
VPDCGRLHGPTQCLRQRRTLAAGLLAERSATKLRHAELQSWRTPIPVAVFVAKPLASNLPISIMMLRTMIPITWRGGQFLCGELLPRLAPDRRRPQMVFIGSARLDFSEGALFHHPVARELPCVSPPSTRRSLRTANLRRRQQWEAPASLATTHAFGPTTCRA